MRFADDSGRRARLDRGNRNQRSFGDALASHFPAVAAKLEEVHGLVEETLALMAVP